MELLTFILVAAAAIAVGLAGRKDDNFLIVLGTLILSLALLIWVDTY